MQESEAFERQLRVTYASIVAESFGRARHFIGLARLARQAGDRAQVRKWLWFVGVSRMAAAEWRKRARHIAPIILCTLWCLVGCAKAPPREFHVVFSVDPAPDGVSVVWALKFTRAQYDDMVDSSANRDDVNTAVHNKVRTLIAAGLESSSLVGCRTDYLVATLEDGGIAFTGSCPIAPRAIPAGGI